MANNYSPFSYADVASNVENIRGARTRNVLAEQQLDPNSVQNQLRREQLAGAKQGNVMAQQQEQRAQTTFDQGQQENNTKILYQALTEISQNPAAAEYHVPRLQEMGVLRSDFDYQSMSPEEIRATAAQGAQAIGESLTPLAKPTTASSSAKNYSLALKQGYKGSFVDYQKEIKKAGATNIDLGLSKGQEAVDKAYAKEYVDFKASGGYADIDKQINQLDVVLTALGGGDDLTGPIIGSMPDKLLNIINPEARSARDAVEEVVQRNLRLVLGAQFTEKEGERLIARAYNPDLEEAENYKRVERLITQIRQASEAKKSAATFFEKNGTLKGWSGKTWTKKDFGIGSEEDISQEDLEFTAKKHGITVEEVKQRMGQR